MDAMVENDAKRRGGMSSSAYGAGKKKLIPDKWRSGFEITVLSAPAIIIFLGFVIFPVFMAAEPVASRGEMVRVPLPSMANLSDWEIMSPF